MDLGFLPDRLAMILICIAIQHAYDLVIQPR